MAIDEIVVWGVGTSRTMRVHWALAELGMDYETKPILARTGETATAAYGRINPKRKIPCLQDGELTLSESAAIAHHLFAKFGPGKDVFLPMSDEDRARSDEWSYFILAELDAHSLYVMRRHGDLHEIYGAAPEAVRSAEEYFLRQLEAVRPRIAGADPYLMGAAISVADILLTTCLDWALRYGIALADDVLRYRERTTDREAYGAAFDFNFGPTGIERPFTPAPGSGT
ncbi:MAG: glutathione S-transferase family protein [Alphaproteobacteria bacterium]|jgi:glutathione S-transferase|nr:glutathione S-transferase family protein [Alphaproteobacteria bacterium]|tara:strand:+ start:515 stop:1198 length:684 start_codon:yes stop_codon:yes gene_type:complete